MKKTLFAGLSVLEPGESLSAENGAFSGRDREATDKLLELGAKTHRHTGVPGVATPSGALGAAVIASGGMIAPSLSVALGYTLEDEEEGETMLSPVSAISTPSSIEAPPIAPVAVVSNAAGTLMVNTYYYAISFTDGIGGETALGPAVSAQRQPSSPTGQVKLSGLATGLVAAGAAGWRLYRAVGGAGYNLLATGGSGEDTFIDDGTHSLDCSTHPLAGSENTTRNASQIKVTLPHVADSRVGFINLYASVTGDFSGGSLLGRFPVASAGAVALFTALELKEHSPPPVNRSIGGAHQIDPDTDLLDWHWKRPVLASAALGSGALGDVRLVENTGSLYGVLVSGGASAAPGWTKLASAGGGSVTNALGWVSVIDPGAVPAVAVKDAEVALASKTIKSPGGHFKASMNGQHFWLLHGGPVLVTGVDAWEAHPLIGTFTYVSPTEGTLSVAAETAVAAGEVIIGPDAGPGIKLAIAAGRGQLPGNAEGKGDFIVATELTGDDYTSLVGAGRGSRLFSGTKKGNVFAAAWKTGIKLEGFDIYGNGWGAQPANTDPGIGATPEWANSGCGVIFAAVKRGVIRDVIPHFCGGNATTAERNGVAGIWLTMGCEECEVDISAALYNRNGINEDNYFGTEYAPLNNSIRCLGADYNYIGVGLDSGSLTRGCNVYAIARHNVIYGIEAHRTNFCTLRGRTEYNGRETGAPGWIVHGDEGSEAEYRGAVVEIDSYLNGGHGGKVSDHYTDFRVCLGINSRNQLNGLYIANKCKRGQIERSICRDNGLGGEFHGVSIAGTCTDIDILVNSFDDQEGPTQKWGVLADATCERITVSDRSYFAGNIKGPVKLEGKECRVGAAGREALATRAQGLLGEAFPRNSGAFASVVLATKKGRASLVGLKAGDRITNLYAHCTVKGETLTDVRLAVWSKTGAVLAKTGNLSAEFGATGVKGGALETALTIPEDGGYYIGILAVGTVPPGILVGTSGVTGYSAQVPAGGIPPSVVENTEKTAIEALALTPTGTAPWMGWS